MALHPFVRRPGPESDYHLQKPMEWHAGTSELVQMLEKGHHNVKLDREGWDRLITWIDLNVPDHGTWHEHAGTTPVMQRRLEMRKLYANRPEDPEAIVPTLFEGAELKNGPVAFVAPHRCRSADAKPPVVERLAVRRVRGRPAAEGPETAADAQAGDWPAARRSNWCWSPPASSSWAAPAGPTTNIRRRA